jgi:hypothetical protein
MNYCIINETTVQFPEVGSQHTLAACCHIQQMSCISQTVCAMTAAHYWSCPVQQCDIWGPLSGVSNFKYSRYIAAVLLDVSN